MLYHRTEHRLQPRSQGLFPARDKALGNEVAQARLPYLFYDKESNNFPSHSAEVSNQALLYMALAVLSLTNRSHVAVRLFSNRSQMTSKCGKSKKMAHEAIAKCVTDVLITF